MRLRLAEELQLVVCFACSMVGFRPISFAMAFLLLALRGLSSSAAASLFHQKLLFTGGLAGALACQGAMTLWRDYHCNCLTIYSFLEMFAIPIVMLIARRGEEPYEAVSRAVRQKYVVPLYLLSLSLLQDQTSVTNASVQLGVFGACCFLLKLRHQSTTRAVLAAVKVGLLYQAVGLFWNLSGPTAWVWMLPLCKFNSLMLPNVLCALWLGDMLFEPPSASQNKAKANRYASEWLPAASQPQPGEYIEMRELRRSLLDKHRGQPEQEALPQVEKGDETVEHSQSYNLVLLLPFFFYNQSILEAPLYVYVLTLEYTQPARLKYLMYCSAAALYTLHHLSSHRYSWLLSASLVLTLNWRVGKGADWLADLRALWLRWCFVLVLALLCWFGLKEVNVFHLGLMTVLLLFITLGSESGSRSFRNRNWKYLLLMFNVFVVSRYVYSMVDGSVRAGGLLELIGLSKDYNADSQSSNFNMLPMIMLAFIVLQYWTYHSRTYQEKSKHVTQIFGSYLRSLSRLSFMLQVLYYKSILWVATIILILVLLLEDFAVTSSLLLAWVLVLFVLQVCQAPPPLLSKLWRVLSRLIAFQIIVRYFFEFTKYKQLHDLLQASSFFQFLVRYQGLLGLSVDYPTTLYLYAITKFQITIALDLVMVFLAFLSMEYLGMLTRGKHPGEDPEDHKAHEIYHSYVLFSITQLEVFSRLRGILKTASRLYLGSFYLLLALYACWQLNPASLMLLLLFCLYFDRVSSFLHETITGQTTVSEVGEAYKRWLSTFHCRTSHLFEDLSRLQDTLLRQQLKIHDTMRKYVSVFLVIDLFLTYSSQLFLKKEAAELLSQETLISLQWVLYLYGTSRLRAGGYIQALLPYLLFCLLLVVELKVCKFVERLADLQYRSRASEQSNSPLSVEPKLREIKSQGPSESSQEPAGPQSLKPEAIKQVKSEVGMRVSLQMGMAKVVERGYVMLLVLCSMMRVTPESISYVVIAFLLNHYGTKGLILTFRFLSLVVAAQYSLALVNLQNTYVYQAMPHAFAELNSRWNLLSLIGFGDEWIEYITFARDSVELAILFISVTLIASLPLYYRLLLQTSEWLLELLSKSHRPKLRQRFHRFFKSAYRYVLVLSPLSITLVSIALYLGQFTIPNMLLCCLSMGFLFREYLADDLSDREHASTFWKAYFRLLQGLIVVFLLGYDIITSPLYRQYCTQLLCGPLSAQSKFSKATLVFLFQVGVDLLRSSQYRFHMDRFYEDSYRRAHLLRIAVAQRENDRKIQQRFRVLEKRSQVHSNLEEVMSFLQRLKQDPACRDVKRELLVPYNVNFLNSLLEFLANLIDPLVMKPVSEVERYVEGINLPLVRLKGIDREGLCSLPAYYDRTFFEEDRPVSELLAYVERVRKDILELGHLQEPQQARAERSSVLEQIHESSSIAHEIEQEVRQTVIVMTAEIEDEGRRNETAAEIQSREELRFKYLLLLETALSNWQLLTFLLMVVEFGSNCGLLLAYYPLAVFLSGMEQQYLASKLFWRTSFLWTMGLVALKYIVGTRLLEIPFAGILLGEDPASLVCELILMAMILCQCFLMHTLGLFKQAVSEVQPMKLALIRNILARENAAQRLQLQAMLHQSCDQADSFLEQVFWKGQHKPGYDYSTFITTIELICLAYCFLFYDRMFLDESVRVSSVVQYNQFTGGMVAWLLIQLFVALLDRFIVLLNLRDYGGRWDCSLLLKYALQCLVLGLVHFMMVWFVPQRSSSHSHNFYSKGFYALYCVYFILSSLQVRDGIDRTSRGFMDRYVWYNGYVYTALRVVPFLFEFKVFSDWFVSKTTMRLFDWIKFEDLFGRLFVAKCNSLFLQGKLMGSKIEWWKKWLMGCPLLLVIVLLIFGPLVLFSSLNPLAAQNKLVGGSAYLTLRINSSNEYPLFINSHISSIQPPTEEQFRNPEIEQIIGNYNIEKETVQLVNLQAYSDTYWEISEGSEKRLLEEPDQSVWELLLTIKFYRQYTSATPIFTLNSLRLPSSLVPQFKDTLVAKGKFLLQDFYQPNIRLDNNNGLHALAERRQSIVIYAQRGKKSLNKYWVIEGGLTFLVVSDKYSQAIFGYSVMGFYISIILVVANYFRFIFQGGANLIGLTDIPMADPLLTICEAIYLARLENDLQTEDRLYWTLIDLIRSPDTVKLLTGNYLEARLRTIALSRLKKE